MLLIFIARLRVLIYENYIFINIIGILIYENYIFINIIGILIYENYNIYQYYRNFKLFIFG